MGKNIYIGKTMLFFGSQRQNGRELVKWEDIAQSEFPHYRKELGFCWIFNRPGVSGAVL